MRHAFQIGLIGIGATLLIAAASGSVQAQAGNSGLRIVAPAITKLSTQRTIDSVRSSMKNGPGSGSGAKDEAINATKIVEKRGQKSVVKPVAARDK